MRRNVTHNFQQQKAGKYNAKPTHVDGHRFASKKEANYYRQLKLRQRAGEVDMFLMQVPFHIEGGVKYVADFLEFRSDGSVVVIDVKGVKTSMYNLKKKLTQHHFPVLVEEV
ncbi:DUF1064 domain-containing protein [Endozoicomonas lisbonensis]|uniref:DUF1064 domain-containing protein n=1 Tax=Endozoicomonas lisbonensis TaxID=3120522 RepID=UPI003398D568